MSISRRKFVQVGAVALIVAGVPAVGADLVLGQGRRGVGPVVTSPGEIPYAAQQDPLFYLTKESFTPYVNSVFRITDDNGLRANFRLFAVDGELSQGKPGPGQLQPQPYSLFFTAGRRSWPQDTYTVTHDALGTFRLLIVPIVSNGEQVYQAVINHQTGL